MGNLETLIKESMEEASLEEDLVRKHARAVGVVSYFFRTSTGWLQPEVEYVPDVPSHCHPSSTIGRFVYDLLLPKGDGSMSFELKPLDGEVEKFEVREIIGSASVGLQTPFINVCSFFPLTRL